MDRIASQLSKEELMLAIKHLTWEQIYAIFDKARYSFDANVVEAVDAAIKEVA